MRTQISGAPETTTATPLHRRTPPWRSAEGLTVALSVAFLTLLEVIPIQAALLTYTATTTATAGNSLAATFGPLWLIVATLLIFALARWRLGEHHPAWLTLTAALIGLAAIALFIALSPTAYGATPGGLFSPAWIARLQTDALTDSPRFNGLFGIAPAVAYLGWRGLTLGAPPPRIEPTLRRFTLSLAVVMIACILAVAAPSAVQPPLQGALLALLALDVFAGLAVAALARRGGGHESAQAEAGAEAARWALTAFGAAALVIIVSFVIGLALNLNLISALLRGLGPVGAFINDALTWLVNGFAYLLWIVFVRTIGAWLFHNSAFYLTPPQHANSAPTQHPQHAVIAPPPAGLVLAAGIIVGLVIAGVLVFAIYVAVRSLLRRLNTDAELEMDEEREALNAGALLRRQARDLLATLRRGAGAGERDPLTPGSPRWLYRETLRAGAAVGIARRPGETADEYSKRLALTLRERNASSGASSDEPALAALTEAYDDARYGERETVASPEMATATRRLTTALGRWRG